MRTMASLPALSFLLAAALLSGCSDGSAPDASSGEDPASPPASPWDGGDRIALYETHPPQRVAAVNICTDYAQPAPEVLQRNGALVPNGTGSIAVSVTNEDQAVGFQVGSRVDGGAIVWLDPVVASTQQFNIPVEPSQAEDNVTGQRWEFLYRYTLAGQGQDCYTGPVLASHPLLIEAVRAEGAPGNQTARAPMG